MATSFKSLLKPKTSPILGTNAIFALPKTAGVSVSPVVPPIPDMSKTSTQSIVLQPPKPATAQPTPTVQPPAPPIAPPVAKQVVRPPTQQAPIVPPPTTETIVPPPQQEAPVVPPPAVQQDTPIIPSAMSSTATPDTTTGESFAKYLDGTAATYKAPVDKYASEIDSMIGGEADKRLKSEIQDEIQQEFRNIERKYAEERTIAERESANRFQEQMSSLAGVGFNPLSSGANNITAANTAVLERFKSNLAAQEQQEKSAVAARINNTKTTAFRNRLDDLRTAQDNLKKDADAELVRNRNQINDVFQNALSALTIQKTKRDLSTGEKNEQFGRVKELLGIYGSSILANMSEVDLRALEASSGLPAGALNAGSKTLKEIESAAKSQLTEVSPGATLFDPVTGQGVFTAPQREGSSGLSQAQINSTVNSIAGAFDNEPIVKNYNTIKSGYEFASSLANKKNPTSTDDQGLIYAFAKAQDPESVVREGEYTTVQKYSQSFIQQKLADAKRLASNQAFLTPEARRNMIATINSKYRATQASYDNLSKEYQRQIDDAYAGKPRQLTNYSGQPSSVTDAVDNQSYIDAAKQELGREPTEEELKQIFPDVFKKPLSMGGKSSEIARIASSIGQYESGGNYQIRGPVVTSGQYKGERALGKYQIMPGNLPSWSKEALGRVVSEQEFLQSPKIQDAIAQHQMGKIYNQYGTLEDVASVWFSGRPVAKAGNAKDVIGTSVPKYVQNIRSIYDRSA